MKDTEYENDIRSRLNKLNIDDLLAKSIKLEQEVRELNQQFENLEARMKESKERLDNLIERCKL